MTQRPAGKVYLVGGGPGDPGLLTLRGAECLARADVVFYDYLVNPVVLVHAAKAECVCLGRHGRDRVVGQEEINRLLVERARQGAVVVRLKGGDPAVFGHLFEEAAALAAAKIAYEVVPGITAALAAAPYAGIPLTQRDAASAVALVTGQEGQDKDAQLDYAGLAGFPGTLVFYMGITTVERWTSQLMAAGKPAQTPAAIVVRASWPDQQVHRMPLGQLAQEVERLHLRPPAVFIVGPVAAERTNVDWFAARRLFGVRVLVTRPAAAADPLSAELADLGAGVIVQPAIEISEPADWAPLDRALGQLSDYEWLVFSSANGVSAFFGRLLASGRDVRALAGLKVAAIGPGTAAALAGYHIQADLVPDEFRAESLAAALASGAAGKRFLLVRASRGRDILARELAAAGGQVAEVVAYTSRDVEAADPRTVELLRSGAIDWVTVTSSAIAQSLARLFGAELHRARLASISPVTSATLRELGLEPAAEASEFTLSGLVAAICAAHERAAHQRAVPPSAP